MAPVVVLAGGVILSHLPTPDSYLQKPCAQPSWLKEGLGKGAAHTHNVHFLLSPVGWGGGENLLVPAGSLFLRDAHTHEAGTPSRLWIPGCADDQELGPGR